MNVWVAIWIHRHGTDAFVATTEAGLYREFAVTAIQPWLDEIDQPEVATALVAALNDGDYEQATLMWGEYQGQYGRDEYVEIQKSFLYGAAIENGLEL